MALYNLKTADGQFRITKFTNDLEVESSYLLSQNECSCPAGSRPVCRHRTMLPKMLNVGAEDSPLFYDFESDKFFEPLTDENDVAGLTDVTSIIAEPTFVEEVTGAAGSAELVEPIAVDTTKYVCPTAMLNEPHPTLGKIKRRV